MDKIKAAILPTVAGIALMLFWQKLDRMQESIDKINELIPSIKVNEYRLNQLEKWQLEASQLVVRHEKILGKHEEFYTLKPNK